MEKTLSFESLLSEVTFKATRSSGKGGQNVNKVSTRIELFFDIYNSGILTDDEKSRLADKLATRVSDEGIFRITSSESRSQLENKENAIRKFLIVVKKALAIPKARKKTKKPKASVEERLKEKKKISEKKKSRKKIP